MWWVVCSGGKNSLQIWIRSWTEGWEARIWLSDLVVYCIFRSIIMIWIIVCDIAVWLGSGDSLIIEYRKIYSVMFKYRIYIYDAI